MAAAPICDPRFEPKPITDLLIKPYLFVIPSFQRGYRCEEKQVIYSRTSSSLQMIRMVAIAISFNLLLLRLVNTVVLMLMKCWTVCNDRQACYCCSNG